MVDNKVEGVPTHLDKVGARLTTGCTVAFAGLAGPSGVLRTGKVEFITPYGGIGVRMPGGTLAIKKPHTIAVLKEGAPHENQ